MSFRVAAAGNSVLNRRVGNIENPAYRELIGKIREADVRFTNLEFSCPDEPWLPSTKADGIHMELYVGVETFVLDEIKEAGFNLLNNANNHAADYLFTGILDTKRKLEERGLAVAGTGRDLQEAGAPVYFEAGGRKAALIAATSTFIQGANAGLHRDGRPGRPGVNALRVRTRQVLDAECWNLLEQLDEKTGTKGVRDVMNAIRLWKDDGTLRFAEGSFIRGEKNGIQEEIWPEDIDRMKAAVEEGKKNADFVIISLHHHQTSTRSAESWMPPEFLVDLAHELVDTGADMIIGHTHQMRPLEIYKGKPILYSPGNFYYTLGKLNKYPADGYAQHGFDDSAGAEDINGFWAGLLGVDREWQSVVPVFTYDGNGLSSIEILPVDLQYLKEEEGIPVLASGQKALSILEKFKEMSAAFGTELEITESDSRRTACVVLK